ncbi:MAG: hypothetical protein JWN46_1686 [Acidimicrobiales bacterium]|nr:hypothetical protein [Acidimicrobiales bacterium]
MSARVVRMGAMIVFFAVGIPGMIVSSIANNTGAGVTFGIIGAIAAVVLLAVTTVTTGRIPPTALSVGTPSPTSSVDEADAEALEAKVAALVASGADEDQVRSLVGAAVRLGRSLTAPARD